MLAGSGWGQSSVPASAEDVLRAVREVRTELEWIRARLGAPRSSAPARALSYASARETYWQARGMLLRAERLFFEQTRFGARLPPPSDQVGSWSEVAKVVMAAGRALQQVRLHLGTDPATPPSSLPAHSPPSDPYAAIMECNDLLDAMLQEGIGPAETCEQLNWAIGLSLRLCLATPGHRIPRDSSPDSPLSPTSSPPSPAKTYATLLECLKLQRAIAARLGLSVAEVGQDEPLAVQDTDLFNLTTLVLAGMDGFHHASAAARQPLQPVPPGPTTSAQLAERADLLQRHLLHLQSLNLERPARAHDDNN